MPTASKDIIVTNKLGLHARPAMQFVDLANSFASEIKVTKFGDDEPTAGFSQDFSPLSRAPRVIRHGFSAPNGTYIVVISWTERVGDSETPAAAEAQPKLTETSFERRVSLLGGEVIVSPD